MADGGVVIEVLESYGLGPASKMYLDAWVNTYGLRVTTVMDPPGTGTHTLDTWGIRETVFLVDLATMQVVQKFNGSITGSGMSSVAQAVPAFLTLLGH